MDASTTYSSVLGQCRQTAVPPRFLPSDCVFAATPPSLCPPANAAWFTCSSRLRFLRSPSLALKPRRRRRRPSPNRRRAQLARDPLNILLRGAPAEHIRCRLPLRTLRPPRRRLLAAAAARAAALTPMVAGLIFTPTARSALVFTPAASRGSMPMPVAALAFLGWVAAWIPLCKLRCVASSNYTWI